MPCTQRPEYRDLLVHVAQHVATLTLNRPNRKNALSPVLINELVWALDDAREDPNVRVIVLTGSHETFCAGADLSQMGGKTEESALPARGDLCELLLRFPKLNKPAIAKVRGVALGGGLGLVASCTFALAAESSMLGTPEVLRGLFPMQIMAVLEPRMPRRRLLEMMLVGLSVPARTAADWGLLTRAVPDGELDAEVARLAATLADRSPTALSMGLEAFHTQLGQPIAEAIPYLRGRLMALLSEPDAIEGLSAFLQKRAPSWHDD
jgi:enoyl-CoA hydratase/carnithine racemase